MRPQKFIFHWTPNQRHRRLSKNVGTGNVKLRKTKLSEPKLCYVNVTLPEEEEHREQELLQEHNQDQEGSRTDAVLCATTSLLTMVWILNESIYY